MTEPTVQTLGRYAIRAELGRGGFATVYRALETTLEREVALKILHPQLLADRIFIERFRKEARALASLRHSQIVMVFEVGEAEGRLYIAMELVHGPSLAQALAERGRIPWNETLALLKPVCEALDYAHAHGVVHRDLKPANILLDRERGPLLTDFGFARLMGESSVSMSLSGGILGTPAYIAPEVWEQEAARPAADIYALGCILFEMLTGQVLFAGKTPMQAMRAHDRGPQLPPTWPQGIPASVEAVLRRALARQPETRYPSALAFWHALNGLEVEAQAARGQAEQAALAAQWRAEASAAMVSGQWSAARMAVGRWLAVAPDDPAAQAARDEIARREVGGKGQEAKSKEQEEQVQQAREERERQARGARVAAPPVTPPPPPRATSRQLTSPPGKPVKRKRLVPMWIWVVCGLLACVICGMTSYLVFKTLFPPSPPTVSPMPALTPASTPASPMPVPQTQSPTPTPRWTPTPMPTPTRTSTQAQSPTPIPTWTPAPMPTPTRTPAPTATWTPTPSVTIGKFIVNILSGKCIDAKGKPGVANETPLQLWDCEFSEPSTTDQRWELTSDGFIKNTLSGKCIDVKGKPGEANESPLQLWDCEFSEPSTTDQRWELTSDGYIKNMWSGKCIDVKGKPGETNESPLQLWDCEFSEPSTTDQRWELR